MRLSRAGWRKASLGARASGARGITDSEGGPRTAAHLLRNHDDTSSPCGAPDPRHREELDKAGEDARVCLKTGLLDENLLLLEQDVDVVQVASSLQLRGPQAEERSPGLGVLLLLEKPSRTLGAHEDEEHQGDGGDEGGCELETPGDVARLPHGQVGAGSHEDTWENPDSVSKLFFLPQVARRMAAAQLPGAGTTCKSSPKAVHSCHDITMVPRMDVGVFSVENTGTVTSFRPIPIPRSIL